MSTDRFSPTTRIVLKTALAAALIVVLILFSTTEVDFVYTGF